MAYDNTNRGSIWKNDRKEKDEHPDFTGSLNVDGVEYWVSAWKRKDGAAAKAPALTFSVRPKETKAAAQNERPRLSAEKLGYVSNPERMDDEIPF